MNSQLNLWPKLLLALMIIVIFGVAFDVTDSSNAMQESVAITNQESLTLRQSSLAEKAPVYNSPDNGKFIWARAFGGEYWDAGGSGVFVDRLGNVYTTGEFTAVADFDPGPGVFNLTCAGSSDIFVSMLDKGGNFVWAKGMGGVDADYGTEIFVDVEGNVYTTGSFQGTADFDPGPGVFNLTSAGYFDFFVSKLNNAGDFVWAKTFGETGTDFSNDIFVDSAGNIYTSGRFEGTVDFDPGPGTFNLTSAGGYDIFISKLDSAGDFVWARTLGGTSSDTGESLFGDTTGNIYTTGSFTGVTDFDPGAGVSNLTSAGGYDIFVSKLDSAGYFVWAEALGGVDFDDGYDIFVDRLGNIYTTGLFTGVADFDPGPATFNLTSAGNYDVFVSKLNVLGDFVWAKALRGTDTEVGNGGIVDSAGNVYTTGRFKGTVDFDPGAGVFNLTSAGDVDIFISKLGEAGDFLWAKRLGGTYQDSGNDIFLDEAGSLYTTGGFYGTVDFDTGPDTFNLTSAGLEDIFVFKLKTTYLVNAPMIFHKAVP